MRWYEILILGCSNYTFYRQIAMDTGWAFSADAMIPMLHTKLVEWILKDEKKEN